MPRILEVVTTNAGAIRTLFEALKDILNEANLEFIAPQPNKFGGIKLTAINKQKTCLINMKLKASNFAKFDIKKPKHSVGVELNSFFKYIRMLEASDTLTFYVDQDRDSELGIQVSNAQKGTLVNMNFKTMEISSKQYDIKDTVFPTQITMESQSFHKLCRELSGISDKVTITNHKSKMIFSVKGESGDIDYIFSGEQDNNVRVKKGKNHLNAENAEQEVNNEVDEPGEEFKPDEIIKGKFELKNLAMFSKCASLCTTIDILMKNNYPLLVRYIVPSKGNILFCLTPSKDDEELDDEEGGEDGEVNNTVDDDE
jgi:proliferating cell nuclear antigen PCNA